MEDIKKTRPSKYEHSSYKLTETKAEYLLCTLKVSLSETQLYSPHLGPMFPFGQSPQDTVATTFISHGSYI